MATRPRFEPSPCSNSSEIPALASHWLPLISAPADFPAEIFETAVSQLIHHPEYNSTLILRADILADTTSDFPTSIPTFEGAVPLHNVQRRLLPRRPGRDAPLEQHCTLYGSDATADTLVLTPVIAPGGSLPYYHPAVAHLAFRHISASPPIIRIEVVPLSSEDPIDLGSRLYRTSLSLLDALHRYGWGALTNYKKRVHHDCVVPREPYQDLYLIMRERFKGLVDTWVESTDPLKHVFEDIGIATFLILLWKDTYPPPPASDVPPDEPWRAWGRPAGGFLDFGCGNGLLTHILLSCGYPGVGVDLRARTSWGTYSPHTQAHLRVDAFDPHVLATGAEPTLYTAPGQFVIANHADELTPWAPLLATRAPASGFLSIPCCAWAFDARFERGKTVAVEGGEKVGGDELAALVESLNLGADAAAAASGYSQYRIWLAQLHRHCGWEIECEVLRIPSTRNWALVGRRRMGDEEEAQAHVDAILQSVWDRGIFKTRTPEGKTGNH
ncbi:hypothetical protein DFH08DRAFT_928974 [Mycena albidolilacea]|uniref:tRNA (uracil-O(2)-)-methyltransferase n=1 Tax=Mycena albidolilacea TaxID=1033008 RepID=A0AAD7F7R2_9AGAR|nr:hypothetical protein DFH08DRAFT_928974 [Mycena albidolilacea]